VTQPGVNNGLKEQEANELERGSLSVDRSEGPGCLPRRKMASSLGGSSGKGVNRCLITFTEWDDS